MFKILGNFLGSYSHTPDAHEEVKTGRLVNDPEVGRIMGDSLATYFGNNNISMTEPFYENETTIRAEDETFTFKLAFKFENNNVVFNW